MTAELRHNSACSEGLMFGNSCICEPEQWIRVADILAAAERVKTFEARLVTDEADGSTCPSVFDRTAVEIVGDAVTLAAALDDHDTPAGGRERDPDA